MAILRPGDRVYPIMSMHKKGIVLEVFVRRHKTMMVDGPLDNTTYVKVEHRDPRTGAVDVVEYRAGDLVKDD